MPLRPLRVRRGGYRLLALKAQRAYDSNLPYLGAFQRSLDEVNDVAMKCGPGLEKRAGKSACSTRREGLDEICRSGGRAVG
jgi:hypothetical protein